MSTQTSTTKEILAGSFGGVIQVYTGQPFDFLKVRLQSAPAGTYTGMLDCLGQTFRTEGPFALYKGTLSPLMGIAFCVSIQFAVLEETKRRMSHRNHGEPLTPAQFYVAGGIAGLANSLISGPVEHIRTRMQVQKDPKVYTSTLKAYQRIFSQYGIQGLYKGQVITMLREWQGYGAYFLAYEWLVQRATVHAGRNKSDLSLWEVMSFGALAGYAMWIPVFPVDSIKSRIQTDALNPAEAKYKGWMDCASKVVKSEGVGALYRGFLPCLLRAAPVNASTFLAYEFAMRMLQSDR